MKFIVVFGLSVFLSQSLVGCVFYPHKTSSFAIRGEILDTSTIAPLSGVKVQVDLPKSREGGKARTDAKGRFTVASEGEWRYLYWLIGRPKDKELIPLEVRVTHEGYESDMIEDQFEAEIEGHRDYDIGAVYMQRYR